MTTVYILALVNIPFPSNTIVVARLRSCAIRTTSIAAMCAATHAVGASIHPENDARVKDESVPKLTSTTHDPTLVLVISITGDFASLAMATTSSAVAHALVRTTTWYLYVSKSSKSHKSSTSQSCRTNTFDPLAPYTSTLPTPTAASYTGTQRRK